MKHVLIVDDEACIRKMIIAMLCNEFSCLEAEDAAMAREILEHQVVDLILCDIQMPGESGLDFSRFSRSAYPDTAIITMTGYGSRTIAQDALKIGVYGHLNKPFENDQLRISIDNALRRIDLEKKNRRRLADLDALVDERTVLLRKSLSELEFTQKKLQESEQKYRSILENMKEGYFRVDMQGRILMTNPAALAILGYDSFEEVQGVHLKNFMMDARQRAEIIQELKQSGGTTNFEIFFKRKDGTSCTGLVNTRSIYTPDGSLQAMEGTLVDISERKRMEEELSISERNLRIIFEKSPLGMLRFSPEGRIAACNEKFVQLMGAPRDVLIGFNSAKRAPAEMRKVVKKAISGQKAIFEDEYTSITGGKSLFLRVVMNPVIPGQNPTEAIVTLEDITERKEFEKELLLTLQKNAQLINNIPSIIIGISPEERILHWNPAAEKIFGISTEKAMYTSLSDCHLLQKNARLYEHIRQCMQTQSSFTVDHLNFSRPDGSDGFLRLSLTPLGLGETAGQGCLIMGNDITECSILETELAQARKLESVGQLAAGIAHEINTPVQYITDNTQFFSESFADLQEIFAAYQELLDVCTQNGVDPPLVERVRATIEKGDLTYLEEEIPVALKQSLEGLGRVTAIVRSMKEFSHPGGKEKKVTDINRALESTITVSRNEWKYVAEMETDLDPDVPLVQCFPGEMNQVFLNLITNAAHAIGDVVGSGGQEKGAIYVSTCQVPGWVEIRIRDTGTGIPTDIQSRIFDPFFTTKEVGKGTGQGLNISRLVVVEKHAGEIRIENSDGTGTTFVIRLPLE